MIRVDLKALFFVNWRSWLLVQRVKYYKKKIQFFAKKIIEICIDFNVPRNKSNNALTISINFYLIWTS